MVTDENVTTIHILNLLNNNVKTMNTCCSAPLDFTELHSELQPMVQLSTVWIGFCYYCYFMRYFRHNYFINLKVNPSNAVFFFIQLKKPSMCRHTASNALNHRYVQQLVMWDLSLCHWITSLLAWGLCGRYEAKHHIICSKINFYWHVR